MFDKIIDTTLLVLVIGTLLTVVYKIPKISNDTLKAREAIHDWHNKG